MSHHYRVAAEWTGNSGAGTTGYRDYERSVTLQVSGKPAIAASADAPFRGDGAKWNPEDLLLASVAQCHLLSYLHACVQRGVVVVSYHDDAEARMELSGNAGRFTGATLRPRIEIASSEMMDDAFAAHHEAHDWCFIANSVSFPIVIEPQISVARGEARA